MLLFNIETVWKLKKLFSAVSFPVGNTASFPHDLAVSSLLPVALSLSFSLAYHMSD
jgi:hypothetical protein